jgi:predicted CXXCH cytochrome family protein
LQLLPQRHKGNRKVDKAHSDNSDLRWVPPHHGVGTVNICAHDGYRNHLRHLPQRHHQDRQTGGVQAVNKPTVHIPTTQQCDICHTKTAWKPTSFSHTGVVPGACATCHNGTLATGKTAAHLATTLACDACHRTAAWKPASFSHAGVAPGSCATCHNGATATGKTATHITTTQACDVCHTTTAWKPTAFSHQGVPAGTCIRW